MRLSHGVKVRKLRGGIVRLEHENRKHRVLLTMEEMRDLSDYRVLLESGWL